MKYIYLSTLLILASATLGSAQFNPGSVNLTTSCENTLAGILGDQQVNACFPTQTVATAIFAPNVTDLNSYAPLADSICSLPKCTDSLVSQTQTTFQNGCSQDLASNNSAAQGFNILFNLYSPTRDSICFKNSTGGYCFIESLTAEEQIEQSAPPNQDPILTFIGAPSGVICTPCNKAIFNTYFNYQKTNPNAFNIPNVTPQNINSARGAVTGKCGSSFLDGNIGDSTESPTQFQASLKKSDAVSLIANRLSFIALVVPIIAAL